MKKIFITANQLLNDGFTLGFSILDSGYQPDLLIAVWRGGTPVAVAVDELLTYKAIPHDHLALRTRHYHGLDQRHAAVEIFDLDAVLRHITPGQKILIVDDVFDTGRSMDALIKAIETHQSDVVIRIATLYYKPGKNLTARTPDYYLHMTEDWLVFPHELTGLDAETLITHKPELPALAKLRG